MAEVSLKRSGIVPLIRERVAAGVPQMAYFSVVSSARFAKVLAIGSNS